jgi:hypothetical protein
VRPATAGPSGGAPSGGGPPGGGRGPPGGGGGPFGGGGSAPGGGGSAPGGGVLRIRDWLRFHDYVFTYHARLHIHVELRMPRFMCPCVMLRYRRLRSRLRTAFLHFI